MWDLWWKKWHWARFSPNTSVSPANSNSTNCPIFINHQHYIGLKMCPISDSLTSKFQEEYTAEEEIFAFKGVPKRRPCKYGIKIFQQFDAECG
jgi:hypothetical protein